MATKGQTPGMITWQSNLPAKPSANNGGGFESAIRALGREAQKRREKQMRELDNETVKKLLQRLFEGL